jgi:hypothetical protein
MMSILKHFLISFAENPLYNMIAAAACQGVLQQGAVPVYSHAALAVAQLDRERQQQQWMSPPDHHVLHLPCTA